MIASASGLLIHTSAMEGTALQPTPPEAVQLPVEGDLPSLGGATLWLNSQPLTAEQLRGKVVFVQFGTYTCIYWRRTLPYIRAWAEKYRDQGLVVIGVHTPEFDFERNLNNVRRALKDIRIDHPIAVDSDRAIWRAFKNEYGGRDSRLRLTRWAFTLSQPGRDNDAAACHGTSLLTRCST